MGMPAANMIGATNTRAMCYGNDVFGISGTGHDSIDGGTGTNVLGIGRSSADIASEHTVGGVTTITFNDGATVNFQNIQTLHFTNGDVPIS